MNKKNPPIEMPIPSSSPRLHHMVIDRLISWNTVTSLVLALASLWVCRHPAQTRAAWRRLEGHALSTRQRDAEQSD